MNEDEKFEREWTELFDAYVEKFGEEPGFNMIAPEEQFDLMREALRTGVPYKDPRPPDAII